jgi:hypothetical protein
MKEPVTTAARNPYAAPSARVADTAPKLRFTVRALRVLAFLGSALLLTPPLLALFSKSPGNVGVYAVSGSCLVAAVTGAMALAFRDRFSYWAAMGANALGIALSAAILVYSLWRGDADWWSALIIALPMLLNLVAVILVRRGRGPSDDTMATR